MAGTGQLMRLAAEMIVPAEVEDDFGRQAKASITFVRYEVDIGHEPATGLQKIGRLVLVRESLQPIRLGDAHRRLRFRHSAKRFRWNALKGRRSGGPFISTQQDEGDQVIVVHQDGVSRGKPKPASAARAPATVVSTITGADDPTILAARREMQSWRRLAVTTNGKPERPSQGEIRCDRLAPDLSPMILSQSTSTPSIFSRYQSKASSSDRDDSGRDEA